MLQSKSTKLISEISSFFSSEEKSLETIIKVIKGLNINRLKIGIEEFPQASYRKSDLLSLCLLFPVFSIENVRRYLGSTLQVSFLSEKDTLYRFKNNPLFDWRSLLYKLNRRILSHTVSDDSPKCLILDDTDFPKTGKKIEHVGRIHSHSPKGSLLGIKALVLGYWDGKSFFGLDFSLKKEQGKNEDRPFGLTKKEIKAQFKKKRVALTPGKQRVDELLVNKIDNGISLITRAYKRAIKFDYVLTDSWFVCEKFIQVALKCKANLLGMAKMGITLYCYNNKQLKAPQIIKSLVRDKKSKWVKCLRMYTAEARVTYNDVPLKLFFFKSSRKAKWHVILTTDCSLKAVRAYQIYSIRWSIEVFFKEGKQHFRLGKSQSRDFDAQIADTSLSLIQYNIFSLAKRIEAYETLGGLFEETQKKALELTLWQRIWELFIEISTLLAETFEIEPNEFMTKILAMENQKQNKLISIFQRTVSNAA